MTAAPLSVAVRTPRPAWRALLWIVPLTIGWTALIYKLPIIPMSGVQTTAHQLTAHALIAVGFWLGLEHTGMSWAQRRAAWLTAMIPYTLWFAVAWSAAIAGAFRVDSASPVPLLPLAIFVPVIVGAPLLLRSKTVGRTLDAMPASWLVGLQIYRIFGAFALAAWLRGAMAGAFALPAGLGDVLTGVLAVPAAIAVSTGTANGRKAAIAWNIVGLFDFAVAITMGIITSPGQLQVIVPSAPSIGAGIYPDVLTPAFVVPSSILLHALSLRQLLRRTAS